jgi:hypothetical protein
MFKNSLVSSVWLNTKVSNKSKCILLFLLEFRTVQSFDCMHLNTIVVDKELNKHGRSEINIRIYRIWVEHILDL